MLEAAGEGAAISLPLKTISGRIVGSLACVGETENIQAIAAWPNSTAAVLAGALATWRQARRSRLARWSDSLRNLVCSRRGVVLLLVAMGLAALMALPVTYRLSCNCTVEAVTRRYVAAPFAGPLAETRVRPADRVHAGDVLAVMDGRETQFELAAVEARLEQAQQRAAVALARHNAATAELEQLAARELATEERILNERRTPRDQSPSGRHRCSGDLRQVGTPLTVGQPLFEIAALDGLLAEVEIPAAEVHHVATGQQVLLSLDAQPGHTFSGRIDRLHPRAEARAGKSVFVAEVKLESQTTQLLPGMSGQARIVTPRQPLGWFSTAPWPRSAELQVAR
jgi:multidrug efflux pump subunit AcrA (membrane-fusion protein)